MYMQLLHRRLNGTLITSLYDDMTKLDCQLLIGSVKYNHASRMSRVQVKEIHRRDSVFSFQCVLYENRVLETLEVETRSTVTTGTKANVESTASQISRNSDLTSRVTIFSHLM